jgi:predicted RNase H-like nuclease (RuvC/YqgF family)
LWKSEQYSYLEKYKQLKRDLKIVKEQEEANSDLKTQIKELRKTLEDKEITISTMRHELKLEKGKHYILI